MLFGGTTDNLPIASNTDNKTGNNTNNETDAALSSVEMLPSSLK